ncbi:probable protein S-acyltransferase 6 [Euphorbia lathyris]|uniref:probable protein S-acyltransferase 6 n=1 Tax=Euphorbia lathyris TaxID=212925 RepID=UPI0033134596
MVGGDGVRGNVHAPSMPAPSHHRPHLSDSNRRIVGTNVPEIRVYQAWRGSNIFCCGGRLVFGPDVRALFFTVMLVVVPVILFCSFISHEIIGEFQPHLGNLIVSTCAIFTAYVILLLFITSSRDPGIIPRNLHPPEDEFSNLSMEWTGILGGGPSVPPTKDVIVNGIIIKVKYCQTCMLYRPPRCSHCSICNNCVERFDHHCPWVGQCIGKRNYRFFFMFVCSTTLLCLYVFAICWVNIKKIMDNYHYNLWRALLKSPVSGILILYTFICAWFVGGLTTFHLYLICTNQTTYENFRYRYDRKMNPFNLGCVLNIMDVFFTKIPKSKNNFRAKVKLDSVYSTAVSMGRRLSPEMPKRSFDVEVGGKRQAVADEDFAEIQSHIDSVGGLERCGTQPRRAHWDQKNKWEITPDIHSMASEFELEHGLSGRQKISEDH